MYTGYWNSCTIYAGGRSVANSLETSSLQFHSTRLLASEDFLHDEIINEQFTRYDGVESQLNYSVSLSVVRKVLSVDFKACWGTSGCRNWSNGWQMVLLCRNSQFFGEDGLRKVHQSFVVVVGLGGVGSHAAAMLLRSGVGKLRLVDFDQVWWSGMFLS